MKKLSIVTPLTICTPPRSKARGGGGCLHKMSHNPRIEPIPENLSQSRCIKRVAYV